MLVFSLIEHCRGLSPLASYGSPKTDTLAVSFLTETGVSRFDRQGKVEEVETFSRLAFKQQTLLAKNLQNGQLLQVTPTAATLLAAESSVTIASWAPEGETSIINASAKSCSAVLNGLSWRNFQMSRMRLDASSTRQSPWTAIGLRPRFIPSQDNIGSS